MWCSQETHSIVCPRKLGRLGGITAWVWSVCSRPTGPSFGYRTGVRGEELVPKDRAWRSMCTRIVDANECTLLGRVVGSMRCIAAPGT